MPAPDFSPDELAILAAVHADPRSDLPRLVYADWLDDRGEAEHAEFIRLQCDRAASDGSDSEYDETPRERTLLRKFGARWRRHRLPKGGRFDPSVDLSFKEFHRGLPHAALVAHNNVSFDVQWRAVTRNLGPHYQLSVSMTVRPGCRPIREVSTAPFLDRAFRLRICGFPDEPLTVESVMALVPVVRRLRLASVNFGFITHAAADLAYQELRPYVPTYAWGFH